MFNWAAHSVQVHYVSVQVVFSMWCVLQNTKPAVSDVKLWSPKIWNCFCSTVWTFTAPGDWLKRFWCVHIYDLHYGRAMKVGMSWKGWCIDLWLLNTDDAQLMTAVLQKLSRPNFGGCSSSKGQECRVTSETNLPRMSLSPCSHVFRSGSAPRFVHTPL